MALNKTFTQSNGITTSYHKVTRVSVNCSDSEMSMGVEMTSYMNEEYRESENPVTSLFYNFDITGEEEQSMSARKLAYAKVKTLPEWEDAADC